MDSRDHRACAKKLLHGLCTNAPGGERLSGAAIPLSALIEVIAASLENDPFFPPEKTPADLGDGAMIERRGRHSFRVHERFEAGQMRYTEIKTSRRYFSLRGATRRYLRHYRQLLKYDAVTIGRFA